MPDIYVPSAGVFEPPWSNFWDDEGEADPTGAVGGASSYKTLRINVDHPIKLTRIAIRALLARDKKGVVCLIASRAGLAGIYNCALYCASKHAIVGFAKSLAAADAVCVISVLFLCSASSSFPPPPFFLVLVLRDDASNGATRWAV